MPRKKEKTDRHGYKADHWDLIRVQTHVLGNQIFATYGLFRNEESKDNGEEPIHLEHIRITIGALQAVHPGVRAALDAEISGPGGALEGSTEI